MNKIEEISKRNKITYKQIAEKAEITNQYVYLLAKGQRDNPSFKIMKKIAEALNEKIENVFV